MNCGFLDVQCQVGAFLHQFWWLPYAAWGVLAVVVLIALAQIKALAGWPGVFAVLTLGAFGAGYWKGKADNKPAAPVQPVTKPPVKKKPKTIIDLLNDK